MTEATGRFIRIVRDWGPGLAERAARKDLTGEFVAENSAEMKGRKVAEAELVMVSTGAGDWLESNGRAARVDGGYLVTAEKRFGSGCPAGALAITSAPWAPYVGAGEAAADIARTHARLRAGDGRLPYPRTATRGDRAPGPRPSVDKEPHDDD